MIEIRGLDMGRMGYFGDHVSVDIIVGVALRIYGIYNNKKFNKMFEVGDICEEASYNLTYLGFIEGIGPKTVKIVGEHNINSPDVKRKRMKLKEFVWRNYDFDLEKIKKHNAEESMCI